MGSEALDIDLLDVPRMRRLRCQDLFIFVDRSSSQELFGEQIVEASATYIEKVDSTGPYRAYEDI